MLRESVTYVITRNETWSGASASEPVEAGWASEAVFFVRALAAPTGAMPRLRAQISPDGMRWVDEGEATDLPSDTDALGVLRVRHFGNWLRVFADLPEGAQAKLLISVHLK